MPKGASREKEKTVLVTEQMARPNGSRPLFCCVRPSSSAGNMRGMGWCGVLDDGATDRVSRPGYLIKAGRFVLAGRW